MKQFATSFVPATRLSRHKSRRDNNSNRFYSAMAGYYKGRKAWPRAHGRWLASQAFDHPAYHILLTEYYQAVEDAGFRLDRLNKLIAETSSSWSMA